VVLDKINCFCTSGHPGSNCGFRLRDAAGMTKGVAGFPFSGAVEITVERGD